MNHDVTSSQSSHHRSNKMIGSNPATSKVEQSMDAAHIAVPRCTAFFKPWTPQTLVQIKGCSKVNSSKFERFMIMMNQWSNQNWSSKPKFQIQIAFLIFNHPDDWLTWDSWDRKTVFNLHGAFVQCRYLQNAILYCTEWPRPRAIHWSSLCTRIQLSQCWTLALDSNAMKLLHGVLPIIEWTRLGRLSVGVDARCGPIQQLAKQKVVVMTSAEIYDSFRCILYSADDKCSLLFINCQTSSFVPEHGITKHNNSSNRTIKSNHWMMEAYLAQAALWLDFSPRHKHECWWAWWLMAQGTAPAMSGIAGALIRLVICACKVALMLRPLSVHVLFKLTKSVLARPSGSCLPDCSEVKVS